jgi:hypothetical protein
MGFWSRVAFGAVALMCSVLAPEAHAQAGTAMRAVPPGFTACATDGGTCSVGAGNRVDVVYGEGLSFVSLWSRTGDFTCLPGNLGISDPSPGRVKTCYTRPTSLSSLPPGYASCGVDGSRCSLGGALVDIVYGVGSSFTSVRARSGDFTCLPADLGVADPAPGRQKQCYVFVMSAVWTACSAEYNPMNMSRIPAQFCTLPGNLSALTVWIGFGNGSGRFYMPVSGALDSIPCNNRLFGDPTPGQPKDCQYAVMAPMNSEIQSGWMPMIREGQSSTLPNPFASSALGWVRYGSGNRWQAYPAFGQVIDCDNNNMNGYDSGVEAYNAVTGIGQTSLRWRSVAYDPALNQTKSCETKPALVDASFTPCANEGGDCVMPDRTRFYIIRYGNTQRDRWVHRIFLGERVSCNNAVMGRDPASGLPKQCSIMPLP